MDTINCTKCGRELAASAKFCSSCGSQMGAAPGASDSSFSASTSGDSSSSFGTGDSASSFGGSSSSSGAGDSYGQSKGNSQGSGYGYGAGYGQSFGYGALPEGYIIAPKSERFLAYIIDAVLMIPFSIGAGIISNIMAFALSMIGARFILISFLSSIISLGGIVLYYVIIQVPKWKLSTSFGKSRLGLKCMDKHSKSSVPFNTMCLREIIGKMISAFVFMLGYIWILIDKDSQGWHDKMFSTIVVKEKIRLY